MLNAAARLVYSRLTSEHTTPLLRELHWLRVPERIQFRLYVLAYHCVHGTAPEYLSDSLPPTSEIVARRCLRSADTTTLQVPSTRRAIYCVSKKLELCDLYNVTYARQCARPLVNTIFLRFRAASEMFGLLAPAFGNGRILEGENSPAELVDGVTMESTVTPLFARVVDAAAVCLQCSPTEKASYVMLLSSFFSGTDSNVDNEC